jgi:hypothetical protein
MADAVLRCPSCGAAMTFVKAHDFCGACGYIEPCCSGECAPDDRRADDHGSEVVRLERPSTASRRAQVVD